MSTCIIIASPILLIPELLMVAIEGLKLVVAQSHELRDVNNCIQKVDLCIKNEVGEVIGIRQNQKSGRTEFVLQGKETETVKATLDKVKQAYSRVKVLNEVKKNGYSSVKEEKLSDGSIRLVVQKWQ